MAGFSIRARAVRTRALIWIWVGVWLVVAWAAPGQTALAADARASVQPLSVLRMTPSGVDVASERQIVFQFNRPVVPIGEMARKSSEIPVTITPPLDCEWRWLDTSALACQLGEAAAFAHATLYRVTMRPGVRAEDGATLAQNFEARFSTPRPVVTQVWFDDWASPGLPEFRLTTNQPVEATSLAKSLAFVLPSGERVPVEFFVPDWMKDQSPSNDFFSLRPQRELAHGTHVLLRVQPGTIALAGPRRGVEKRVLVEFDTLAQFRLLGVQCTTLADKTIVLEVGQDSTQECDPLERTALLFSAPFAKSEVVEKLNFEPKLAGLGTDEDPWQDIADAAHWVELDAGRKAYALALPHGLKAKWEYRITAAANPQRDASRGAQHDAQYAAQRDALHNPQQGTPKDVFGRPLAEAIDFRFRTSHRRPQIVMPNFSSVLEAQVESHLPVVLTNLDSLRVSYTKLMGSGVEESNVSEKLPQVQDIAFFHPLKVREWLQGKSGIVSGRVDAYVGKEVFENQSFLSIVTPYSVHAKIGHYNTLVWVTDFKTGKPVADAKVRFLSGDALNLAALSVLDPEVRTNKEGIALLPGTDVIDPKLDKMREGYWSTFGPDGLFVRVEKDGELALLPVRENFEVDAKERAGDYISNYPNPKNGHLVAWGTTAQGIYRAGDTIQYKFYLRNNANDRLSRAPQSGYDLAVYDPKNEVVCEVKNLTLNYVGSYHGECAVPKAGAVGWYRFEVRAPFLPEHYELTPIRVLVSDFTPSPFRVKADLEGKLFRDGETARVSTSAALHAGGPYTEAPARVTATLAHKTFTSPDPRAKGFVFDVGPWDEPEMLHQSEAMLDTDGKLESQFAIHSEKILYGTLQVEAAVRDDRGKYIAGRTSADFAARDRFVGLRQDVWLMQSGRAEEVLAVAVDVAGKPVAGVAIEVMVERDEVKASRVKSAGNAYLTKYIHEWKPVATCALVSEVEAVACRFTPDRAGEYRLRAKIQDTQNKEVSSEISSYALGKGRVLWEESPGDLLPIRVEEDSLRVGDTVRLFVKNPFPGAKALVTIERYGVIKSWTTTLRFNLEVIEFPVETNFLPGFYASVVVMSPRVQTPPEAGQVDLGKPAFRMGYAQIRVEDLYKQLDVSVLPQKKSVKPREKVSVEISVKTKQGKVPEDLELAVAVLDEAVLDLLLQGVDTFDPHKGLNSFESLDVRNLNLIKQLIGLQKFEKKGASPGGDGGLNPRMRTLFKFVSYWNPSLRPDAKGRAKIEFEVPDNLTGWRVLVLAVTPEDRLGLGHASFAVNTRTEIRPALPNQVTEGDRFEARFTILNRAETARTLQVTASATGAVVGAPKLAKSVTVESFKRAVVGLPIEAGAKGKLQIRVRAGDALDADALELPLVVNPAQALEASANYASTTQGSVEETIQFPENLRTDVGRVSVMLSPTVLGGVDGAFEYMRDYPYPCWEQRLTKGVMAAHYLNLRAHLPDALTWPEADAQVKQLLADAVNFQAPDGGMTYWTPKPEFVSPYLSAYTALAFTWLRESGHVIPATVEANLQQYLLKLLRTDVFPGFYTEGMESSVRAVALAALARAGKLTLSDVERYRTHVTQMDLFGKAHYMQALTLLKADVAWQNEVSTLILSHANQSGGKFTFTEKLDTLYSQILYSDTRSHCAILSAFVQREKAGTPTPGSDGLAMKLVREISARRKQKRYWQNTQENLFCMNAFIDYSRRYEADKPDFAARVFLGEAPLGEAKFTGFQEPPQVFDSAITDGDAGRKAKLRVERSGIGRLYYFTRLFFSPKILKRDPINAGIEIHKEVYVERDGKWTLLASPMQIQRGDLLRVDLFLSLPAARSFVVVNDPIPGGLEPVNRDLATASRVDADKESTDYPSDSFYFRYSDWRYFSFSFYGFYHRELRHDSARFYSEYLHPGRYHLSYVAQAIAPGTFQMLPARAEEMYDPDVFGQVAPSVLEVRDVVDAADAKE